MVIVPTIKGEKTYMPDDPKFRNQTGHASVPTPDAQDIGYDTAWAKEALAQKMHLYRSICTANSKPDTMCSAVSRYAELLSSCDNAYESEAFAMKTAIQEAEAFYSAMRAKQDLTEKQIERADCSPEEMAKLLRKRIQYRLRLTSYIMIIKICRPLNGRHTKNARG